MLLYVPVFGYLDSMCIRLWDEARLSANAYEMVYNGKLAVTYYEGAPDMWNTKPPLLIWCQAAMIKCIGFNEIAVRLPSALATLFTCAAIVFFAVRYFESFRLGFIAILVLITSHGYVGMHSTRFGEYDAMLTLFTTAYSLCFFMYMEEKKTKYLYAFFVLLSLAVLTKGIAGVLFLPALALYALWKKQLLSIFKNKHAYIGGLIFLMLAGGYYLLREYQNPGYLHAVSENELGGRFNDTIEGHAQPFSHYYDNNISGRFIPWFYFLPFGLLVVFYHKNKLFRDLAVFLVLLIITFFVIISSAKTKIYWYDIPLYPFMALLVALSLHSLLYLFENFTSSKPKITAVFSFLFLLIIFIQPYLSILAKTHLPKETEGDQLFFDVSYYLKSAVKGKVDLNNQYFLCDEYAPHFQFYLYMLQEKNVKVSMKKMTEVKIGDTIFFSKTRTNCDSKFLYTILNEHNTIVTCKIIGEK